MCGDGEGVVASGGYSIAVFADLQDTFDAVCRKGALYKLHKAGITNNLLSEFSNFLTDKFYRILVNSYTSDWACTTNSGLRRSLSAILYFWFLLLIPS